VTLGVVLTLLALVWLWLVDNYIPNVATEGEPGPRALPFLLGIFLAILGVALAYAGRVPASSSVRQAQPDRSSNEWRVALTTVALLLAYTFLLDKLGFITSTAVLMLAAMAGVLGMRRWVFMAVFAAAFATGSWLVFNTLLGIPLPRDPWLVSVQ
jgi:putative tricarboxylic transport membrane protein